MPTTVPRKIDVQTIPLLALPSLPFNERRRLPSCAAIYFVLNAAGTVLYIGQSINLAVRWVAHHRATKLADKQATRIAWLVMDDETLLNAVESACIAYFEPLCNGMRDPAPDDRVTIHLKTDRHVRDRLLGALRADGTTMQEFFEHLMQPLSRSPSAFKRLRAHGMGATTASEETRRETSPGGPETPRKLRLPDRSPLCP